MFSRRIASLVMLALLGITSAAPGVAAAQRSQSALKMFTSARFGYTLSYPASWRTLPSANLDIMLEAPDTYARVAGKGIEAGLSTAALRQAVDSTIGQMGTPATKILRATRVIHGVPFQVAQATVLIVGVKEQVVLLAASRHQRTYLFFGIVALAKQPNRPQPSHINEELEQLKASLSSITIAQ